jgi:flagellar biosynthetic protein FliR
VIGELLVAEVIAFLIVLTRIAGFVVVSPFPGDTVPRTARIGLALALAFLATAVGPPPAFSPSIDLRLVPIVASEAGLGLMIGFSFRLILNANVVAGETMAQSIGLGSATIFNPAFGSQDTVLSRILSLFAMAIVLAAGLHRFAIAWLLDTFTAVPIGSALELGGSAMVLVDLLARASEAGLRLAMPVVAVSLVVQVGLAMLARIAPSLQIFNVGFAALLAAGLLTLGASLRDILGWFMEHAMTLPDWFDRLLLQIVREP